MASMAPEDWDRVLATSATGAYNAMHAVLPQMLERGDGLIVNISSVAGKRASELGGVAYCAAKFAQAAAKLGLADHLADGPRSASDLAPVTGTHAPTLHRFMRTLAGLGILTEGDGQRFALTPLGEALKDGFRILGYLHWSLTDNFEWGSYAPRFGLYTVNVRTGPTLRRIPTAAVPVYQEIIRNRGVAPGYRPVTPQ
jgi:hypothetical protein